MVQVTERSYLLEHDQHFFVPDNLEKLHNQEELAIMDLSYIERQDVDQQPVINRMQAAPYRTIIRNTAQYYLACMMLLLTVALYFMMFFFILTGGHIIFDKVLMLYLIVIFSGTFCAFFTIRIYMNWVDKEESGKAISAAFWAVWRPVVAIVILALLAQVVAKFAEEAVELATVDGGGIIW